MGCTAPAALPAATPGEACRPGGSRAGAVPCGAAVPSCPTAAVAAGPARAAYAADTTQTASARTTANRTSGTRIAAGATGPTIEARCVEIGAPISTPTAGTAIAALPTTAPDPTRSRGTALTTSTAIATGITRRSRREDSCHAVQPREAIATGSTHTAGTGPARRTSSARTPTNSTSGTRSTACTTGTTIEARQPGVGARTA